MLSFSQRNGLEPVKKLIQVDSIDDRLRTAIWNVLDRVFWIAPGFLTPARGYDPKMERFSRYLWENFLHRPADARPVLQKKRLELIREWFFNAKWNRVYDFVQFLVQPETGLRDDLTIFLNQALERGGSGYRIINGIVAGIVSEGEVEMLQKTLDEPFSEPVSAHLRRALQLLANRDEPDYRNSIKESISAVESMAKIITGNSKATLGGALKEIEKSGRMHPVLKEAFQKLYGYTSDEDGIRHAMLAEPKLTAADAKYFLMSCTSFVNYMKSQSNA
jgi:hypothetical protein